MDPILADVVDLLTLEQIEVDIFRGESRDIGSPQVFGGQVLGQALWAASRTVEDRYVHSLHAYFLRRGDFNAPIVYQVDRPRDGRSFTNRRITAIQHGRQIFNMTASFQVEESGLEHAALMPDVPRPDTLKSLGDVPEEMLKNLPERVCRFLTRQRPFELRPVRPDYHLKPDRIEPVNHIWVRQRPITGRSESARSPAGIRLGLRVARYRHAAARRQHARW